MNTLFVEHGGSNNSTAIKRPLSPPSNHPCAVRIALTMSPTRKSSLIRRRGVGLPFFLRFGIPALLSTRRPSLVKVPSRTISRTLLLIASRLPPDPSSFTPGTDCNSYKSKITVPTQMPLQLPNPRFRTPTPRLDILAQDDLCMRVKAIKQRIHFFVGHVRVLPRSK